MNARLMLQLEGGILGLFVLYVLSIGPVVQFADAKYGWKQSRELLRYGVYEPLHWTLTSNSATCTAYARYMKFWAAAFGGTAVDVTWI